MIDYEFEGNTFKATNGTNTHELFAHSWQIFRATNYTNTHESFVHLWQLNK
ncbi:MAG: hypothetical protein KatS3mg027_2438 [Bacteroidia bacterium]|nr:MAG: hypothetical protein KatS3mg027_2438 [Bacteroidia bacterium]